MEHAASATETPIRFETHPSLYVHWRLEIEPPLARLVMDVQEERALRGDYPLKLNSYDLGVDLELADAIQRLRFEHPEVRTVILTAFSTSSSNATLPTALRVSELNLGVPRDIGAFVLTVGATANQNGTALYEGVTVLFLAQLAGVDLTLSQQLMVLYLAILGSIGTAGVPSGSIPFVVAVLVTVGINPALIAVIIGVDRLLDMCRTTLNVIGDMTAAVYVARSEGATLNFK